MKLSNKLSIFSIAIVAFPAVGIHYFNLVFTKTSRWAILAVLTVSVLASAREALRTRPQRFTLIVLSCYYAWCLMTVWWSEVPILSFLKTCALIWMTSVLLLSGGLWGRRFGGRTLSYLFLTMVLSFVAAFFGEATQRDVLASNEYSGLTGNANLLGILAAISVAYVLFRFYLAIFEEGRQTNVVVASALGIAIAVVLWLAESRASLLCATLITLCFVKALNPGRKVMLLVLAVSIGVAGVVAFPAIKNTIYMRFIVKGQTSGDILYSRSEVWDKSLNAAYKGGWTGVGLGVSAGDSSFAVRLTSVGYGREKGNSQLAIWEELGLVGLGLYVLVLAAIYKEIRASIKGAANARERVEAWLLAGLLGGLLAQSVFEAWWTSPGSTESTYFWATVGVVVGIGQRQRQRKKAFVAHARMQSEIAARRWAVGVS